MNHHRQSGLSLASILAIVVILVAGAIGYTEIKKRNAREALAQAITTSTAELDKTLGKWNDAMTLAGSAPRIGLSGPIASLQAIKQSTGQVPAPDCMTKSKAHMLQGMQDGIDGMIAFMRNDMPKYDLEEFTSSKIAKMRQELQAYEENKTACKAHLR